MTQPVTRNSVVSLLGTPHATEGSLNDPVERQEFGIHYNEKWTYKDLGDDPAGVPNRVIYWHRYDFVATMVRANENDEWRPDTKLIEAADAVNARLATVHDHHPSYPNHGRYRPVSQPQDWRDLGGYMQDEATGRRINKTEP
ncbi:MAG: hypothetical protein JO189_01295 [Deltaproteobacteria bacterium]|nr:hypothetical protein [Deltaproteobacteria bacterium]